MAVLGCNPLAMALNQYQGQAKSNAFRTSSIAPDFDLQVVRQCQLSRSDIMET